MSLCATCRLPGRCCAGFPLNVVRGPTALHVLVRLATISHAGNDEDAWESAHADDPNAQLGVPFLPLWRTPRGGWRFWCPVLGRDGRCTDYDNRPGVCRAFAAGSNRLCAEWTPPAPDGALLKKPATEGGV